MITPKIGDGINTDRHGTGKIVGVEIPRPNGHCKIYKGENGNRIIAAFHSAAIKNRCIDVTWPRHIVDLNKPDDLGRERLSFSNMEIVKSNLEKFDFIETELDAEQYDWEHGFFDVRKPKAPKKFSMIKRILRMNPVFKRNRLRMLREFKENVRIGVGIISRL